MGLVDDILIILSSYSGGYRLMRARMMGSTYRPGARSSGAARLKCASDNAMRVTLSRLRRKGYVSNKNGAWGITKTGREYLEKKISSFLPAHSAKKISKHESKGIIISFDIPERYKRRRDWLRVELLCLGFEMLQKSVWIGLAPVPQEFADSLRKLELLPYIKFFEAKKTEII